MTTAQASARHAGPSSALVAHLRGMREPRMRVAAASGALARGSAPEVARLLHDLIARGGDRAPAHRAALDAVLLALSDSAGLGYERRAELYEAAVQDGRREVALLLLESAPPVPGTEALEQKLGDARPLVPTGRALTLGERKSLARGHRRDLLLQLLRDPHPDVVEILLGNPHVTESDVVRLASRRPMLPDSLATIAASERWRFRAAVRRALVLNPFTPMPLAARLMTTLSDRDLDAIAVDPAMPAALTRHAAGIAALRREARGDRRGPVS